jgi:uncharacterized protein YndB with AHSA1/START domain
MTVSQVSAPLVKFGTYPHPPEMVWEALTNGEAMAQWLMPNNLRPPIEVGRKFEFRFDPIPFIGGLVKCEIIEMEPPRLLVWSWVGIKPKGSQFPPLRVEWELTTEGAGTRLELRVHGNQGLPWIMRKMMAFGWGTMVGRWLPPVLGGFERDSAGGLRYKRLAKAPNRGHQGVKSIPDEFFKS